MTRWLGLVSFEDNTVIDLCPVCRKPRTKADIDALKAVFIGKDPRRCIHCLTKESTELRERDPTGTPIFPLQFEIQQVKRTTKRPEAISS